MTTIADVLAFTGPTDDFLVPVEANTYGIEFTSFALRCMDRGITLFSNSKDPNIPDEVLAKNRSIQYYFGPGFFSLKTVGANVEFKVGASPVKNFVMIERHYFRNKLLQSYEFKFPFCMPKTTNTFEQIYDLPTISPEDQQVMIAHPWETKSDTFYFVDGVLIMHNKAEYSYAQNP